MRKIVIEDVSLFCLGTEEFYDAGIKNQCIAETQTSYIAICPESLEESIRENFWRERNPEKLLVLYDGIGKENPEHEELFLLEPEKMIGFLFPKKMIRQCGGFSEAFFEAGNLEFLCRAALTSFSCKLLSVERAESAKEGAADYALAGAYLIRFHMKHLHRLGLTDKVFQNLCGNMQQRGCFAEFQQYLNAFLGKEELFDEFAVSTAPFLVMRGDDTCMGVLQNFSDDLADALADQGQAVIMVGDDPEQYDSLQGGNYKGIIGFQTRALEIDFFRNLKGKKFQFWLDYPLHFEGVLRNLPKEYYILCQDADYASQIRNYYHTPNAIQFPPGGVMQEYQKGVRPYDIVFVGSYFADESEGLTQEQRIFYNYMIQNPAIPFEQGLCEVLGITREESFTEEFEERMRRLKPACRAVIGHYREKVLKTILKSGYTIQVYGEDWNKFRTKLGEQAKEHLVIHPQVSVRESLEELKKAKIGLNVMSWHKAGMTERIANIMLSGAVCLSDETMFLREQMEENREVVLFELEKLEELPIKIGELLGHPQVREEIAQRGYEKAKDCYSWDARAKELIALAEQKDESNSVEIFVATHVAFNPPENPIYTPLHVGRKGKPDLGYLGDDTGENISDLNFLYGELTGLFWIWQNVYDVPYVGLCHYRRYFINNAMTEMRQEEYLELLKDCDAIVPKHMQCDGGESYYRQFGKAHNSRDLDAVGRALKKLYPEYADAYDNAMEGNIFYWGNLMVTSLDILKAYAEWLFTIFAEAGEEIDVSGYDDYHKRVFGFLSEQMFYVFALANNLQLREAAVGVSAEKAETRELKVMLKQLLADGRKQQAKELLEKELKRRPDLLLPGSDIKNELAEIYRILIQE